MVFRHLEQTFPRNILGKSSNYSIMRLFLNLITLGSLILVSNSVLELGLVFGAGFGFGIGIGLKFL